MAARKNPPRKLVPELWMICNATSSTIYNTKPNPKKLYSSEQEARQDAETLVQKEQHTFYLLKVVALVQPAAPPVEWLEE